MYVNCEARYCYCCRVGSEHDRTGGNPESQRDIFPRGRLANSSVLNTSIYLCKSISSHQHRHDEASGALKEDDETHGSPFDRLQIAAAAAR